MRQRKTLLLVLGLLLVAAPFTSRVVRAEEPDEYGDEELEESPEGGEPEEDVDEKDVIVLTDSNFDDIIKKSKFALVEFYAPWCGHCQRLKPEYAKAATAIKELDPSIVIAKVDATEAKDVASNFNVEGYPTIKWFIDGEVASDYGGGRDSDGIIRWVKKKTGPPAVTLDDVSALSKLEAGETVIAVGYFKKFEGAEFDAFVKVARTSEDVSFAQTTSAAVAKEAGLSKPGAVVISNFPGEERTLVPLVDDLTADALEALILAEKLPPTLEFNDENSSKIFGAGINKHLLLCANEDDLTPGSDISKWLRAAHKKLKGKIVFVTVNMQGQSKEPVANFFSVSDEDAPVALGFEMDTNKKFRLRKPLSEASIVEFATAVVEGTIKPEYKSAPEPAEPKDGGVAIVVGTTFEAIVKDTKKDVLLEVYAPWCGHCQSLEPIYKKLAARFSDVAGVVVAKMDGTENEHPDVDVQGFPHIVLFPAGEGKDPVTYEGGRTLKELTKFIKAHATNPVELPPSVEEEDAKEPEPEPEGEADSEEPSIIDEDIEEDAKEEL